MPLTTHVFSTLAESPLMLVSWWKSLFLLATVVPWAIGLAGATPVAAWRHRRRTSRD